MDHPGGFAPSPWAAVLGHHAGAGIGMMQHDYGHPHPGTAMPMDLHVPQPFPYYRYREDALCWSDRKPSLDDVGHPTSVNARLQDYHNEHVALSGSNVILELRKEKSRDAARSRRGKENYEFYELAKMLPLPAAITSQLDKASIIRLTISYLKLRDFSGHGDPPWSRDMPPSKQFKGAPNRRTPAGLALELFEQHQGTHILQSLDGFALSVAADGRFLYISETVSIYLGLSQVEMTGSSIFDYIHQADHAEVAEHLGLSLVTSGSGSGNSGSASGGGVNSPSSATDEDGVPTTGTNNPDVSAQMTLAGSSSLYRGMDRAFCVRMKSTLTKRGCHFKSSGYRVVLMLCRLRPQYSFSHNRKSPPPLLGMVGLAIALPPPSVHEIRLESDMFVTRVNFDFRIAHCEPKVSDLLDYTSEELTGKNLYTLCHGEDANRLRKCHIDLINKGQVLTHYYRLMNKSGGYTWIQTCATVVCSSKNAEEQNIICVNYVISGREYANLIMDCCQMDEGVQGVKKEESGGDPGEGSPDAGADHTRPSSPRAHPAPDHPPPPPPPSQSAPPAPPTQPTPPAPPARRARKRKAQQLDDEPSPEDTELNSCRTSISPSPVHDTVSPQITPAPPEEIITDTASVKDLENAMSKHLPTTVLNPNKTGSPTSHQPTDFSTDTLLKQQQHKSTIQWIGAHHQLGAPGLPASALLRQLYASRESVIRAAGHGQPSHPHSHTHSHPAGPLPTPPGSEGSVYNDQFIALHAQKNADSFQNLVSTYGGPAYSMDYHSAMTPPGSVSPRDKQPQHTGFDSQYSDSLRHGYIPSSESPAQPLPLKPQVYSALEYTSPLEQSQFYPGGSGFHLYHPSSKATPPASNWYSTAS